MQPKQCIAIIDSIKAYAKQNPAEAQVYEDWFQAVVNLRDALPQDKRFDAYKYSGESVSYTHLTLPTTERV